jgi:hypothetical protein
MPNVASSRPGRYLHIVRRYARALLLLVAVAAAVIATGVASSQPAERPVGDLRDCRSRGEGRSPQKLPPTPGVRIGPLLFWPSIKIRQGYEPNGSEWPWVVKAPVILPARTNLVLAIAPEAKGLAGFQHLGRFVSAIRFQACRERVPAFAYAGTVGKYTGFPFALGLTRRSACVPMEVWVDGRAAPLRRVVPIGRSSC